MKLKQTGGQFYKSNEVMDLIPVEEFIRVFFVTCSQNLIFLITYGKHKLKQLKLTWLRMPAASSADIM